MTRYLNILSPLLLIAASPLCHTMETPTITKKQNLLQLTATTEPRQALYLTNNRILISDIKGCRIIDPTTDTIIKQISSSKNPHIAIHPNKTKFALAYKKKVIIYNSKTGKKEWTSTTPPTARISSSIFSPLDDTIFIRYKNVPTITRHTYHNDKFCIFGCNFDHFRAPLITFNPTQRDIALSTTEVDWYNYNRNRDNTERIVHIGERHDFCEYSPDGSKIASGSRWGLYISDLYNTKEYLHQKNTKPFVQIKFHPNSSFLATLSSLGLHSDDAIVSYWDTKTLLLIRAMPPLFFKRPHHFSRIHYELSFSPDGKNLLVTVPGKCVVMPVPFEVIYQPDTKEKAIFAYWLLKNYNHDQQNIPIDIIRLLIYNLFELCKR